ncbi:MAG: DUF2326 domain-containing protein [Eggerthellaceae bacterium]|nr:DUF2326 domain-containing protein [Eggerthellaceae bacterium]
MLTKIYCDQLKDQGAIRPPIHFHSGLNVILGSSSAANSIGKTTFLLMIDFAFGGNSYLKSDSTIEAVGPHTILFTFEFDGTEYHFSRSTITPDFVHLLDSHNNELDAWPIKQFCSWLKTKYGMDDLHGTFRGLVSNFFRIYGKDNYDEKRPLSSYAQDSAQNGIERLLELFDKYEQIESLKTELKTAEARKKTFRKANEFHFVNLATNAKEAKENENEIGRIKSKLHSLIEQSNEGLADIDPVIAERTSDLKRDISKLRRARTRLSAQLATIDDDEAIEPYKATNDFASLQTFFPNANIKHLEEIESFHHQVTEVLKKERKNARTSIQADIDDLDKQIQKLNQEIRNIGLTPTVSTIILESYADLTRQLNALETANAGYKTLKELEAERKRCKDNLERETESILRAIEQALNYEMEQKNSFVCGPAKTAPHISIPSTKKYSFGIPNDTGTGSQTRGMFLLDYALLTLTNLPAFAHDTNTIKQVQDDVVLNLFKLYDTSKKQVFVAIDKAESFTDGELPEIIEANTVIRLSTGHELFGKAWNEDKDEVGKNAR